MNVAETIKARHSIRGFKPDRVDPKILHHIFDTARWSASNCNIQSWRVDIVSGQAKDTLSKQMLGEIMAGKEVYPDFEAGNANLYGVYRDRQYACAMGYYSTMGIERSDKKGRNELMLKNWQFFDAPHVAFISMPKVMNQVNAVDIGIYLQNVMLLMVENGLGSCAQGALAFYPGPAKAMLNIPEDHGILVGLSFGYPDEDAQINRVRMDREPVENHVFFKE